MAKKKESKDILSIVHWVITGVLFVTVIYLGAMMYVAYAEITILKSFDWINMENTNNVMRCVNESDTECKMNKYRNTEKYWLDINETYKKIPGSHK